MTANLHLSDDFYGLYQLELLLRDESITISRQQLKVLYWAFHGKNNVEISTLLGTSISTIKSHKNKLIAQIGRKGRADFRRFLFEKSSLKWGNEELSLFKSDSLRFDQLT